MNALVTSLVLLWGAPPLLPGPTIDVVTPDPLVAGGLAEILGSGFEPSATIVRLGDVVQQVVVVQSDEVLFKVAADTPVGTAALYVETPGGAATLDVEVAPPPPTILSVTPDPVVLGQVATIHGADLATVSAVTLGGLLCDVTAQSQILIAFLPPMDPSIVGLTALEAATATGSDTAMVNVAPPTPSIDTLSPNPIRQGDLLTVSGNLVAWNIAVAVAGAEGTVLEASSGSVVVQVPPDASTGPTDVVVHVGDVASEAAGPLHVEVADAHRPRVELIVPNTVVVGGSAWVWGQDLDEVTEAAGGITVDACDEKLCHVGFVEPTPGQLVAAVSGPKGADVFTMQLVDDSPLVLPTIDSVSPQPAFRGDKLTIQGSELHDVSMVVIGGQVQTIDYVGVDEVRITVGAETSMGAERLVVAGSSASNMIDVVVLEHWAEPVPDAVEPDPVEPVGDAGATETSTPDTVDEGGPSGGSSGSGGGCAGAPTGPPAWSLAALLLLALATRRRDKPQANGSAPGHP